MYRDPVRLWEGATQSFEVDHFRDEGFKMEVTGLPVELAGVRLPGMGQAFQRSMAEYPRMAVWGVQIRAEAEGSVSPANGRSDLRYTPTPADMEIFRRGARRLAEMHFAAGALRVYPGRARRTGRHRVARRSRPARRAAPRPAATGRSSRVTSSARAAWAKDERAGVVGYDGAVHGTRGLWVLDASALPTNLGVNPQHTIMALATLLAERLV